MGRKSIGSGRAYTRRNERTKYKEWHIETKLLLLGMEFSKESIHKMRDSKIEGIEQTSKETDALQAFSTCKPISGFCSGCGNNFWNEAARPEQNGVIIFIGSPSAYNTSVDAFN